MFPPEILISYLAAALLIVIAPGPDSILAVSRGLSQGGSAAILSSIGAGLGIMFHSVAATLGLTLVFQASALAFWVVKITGGLYLLWLGYKALRSRSLVSLSPADRLPLRKVFAVGLLSNILNPKPGLFVIAFVPQFVSPGRGSVQWQMLAYGAIFALLTFVVFSMLGCFSARLSAWLAEHPKVVKRVNTGAGLTFIGAGVSVLMLKRGTP